MKTNKKESKLHYIEEMIDSMKESIENIKTVVKEQNILIEVIKSSDKKDYFKKFIEETEKQIKELGSQKDKITKRIEYATEIVNKAKSDKSIDEVVNLLMDTFGMFDEND